MARCEVVNRGERHRSQHLRVLQVGVRGLRIGGTGRTHEEDGHYYGSIRDAHDDRPTDRRRVRAAGGHRWLPDVDAPNRLVSPVPANPLWSSGGGEPPTRLVPPIRPNL